MAGAAMLGPTGLNPACDRMLGPDEPSNRGGPPADIPLESIILDPAAREPAYWRAKPALAETLLFSPRPSADSADREALARMLRGEVQVSRYYPWLAIGVPPPWDDNPLNDETWDFYRHTLQWVAPLVHVWVADGDDAALQLARRVITDWIEENPEPRGASPLAWREHPVSYRARLLAWFWELYRTRDSFDWEFGQTLLDAMYRHGRFLAEPTNYEYGSNHGLEMDGALLATAVTLPELADAAAWRELALRRMTDYVEDNFSPKGFHFEQSPGYHWYVVSRLSEIIHDARINGLELPPEVEEVARRAVAVWPYLVRPDGSIPNVGDSQTTFGSDWRKHLRTWWRDDVPARAGSSLPQTRLGVGHGEAAPAGRGEFVLSFEAGYAVFTSYALDDDRPNTDTHVLFRCNAFEYTHAQNDALSFTLYGLGRDWLVDSGLYNYDEQSPGRRYMRSARAHNVVLVDEGDFESGRIELKDWDRTSRHDSVTVSHELPRARHLRSLRYIWPRRVEITDELSATDGRPHAYSQVFHVAPDLKVKVVSAQHVELVAQSGDACVIEQLGQAGEWRIIRGQKRPYWQGWYSARFLELVPNATLYYTTPRMSSCVFETRVWLVEAER
jgi:hypothetical protein